MIKSNKFIKLDYYLKYLKILIKKQFNFLFRIYLVIIIKNKYCSPQKYLLPIGAITIRQYIKEDLMEISNIFDKTFTHLSFNEKRTYFQETQKNMCAYPAINIVAEHNGKCIGFITTKPEVHLKSFRLEHSLKITWMAVDISHRGYKISEIMLRYLYTNAKNVNAIGKITTQTSISNVPALKAYKYLGFRKIGVIPEFILKEDGIKLEKNL